MATRHVRAGGTPSWDLNYERCRRVLSQHFMPRDEDAFSRWNREVHLFLRRVRVHTDHSQLTLRTTYRVEWGADLEVDGGTWELALIVDDTELVAFDAWLIMKAAEELG